MGMDLNLARKGAEEISVPPNAAGGVGGLGDIKDAIDSGASAVSAGA